jgi:hypothetical protein
MERETGFEPATACLEGRNSTAELLPHNSRIGSRGVTVKAVGVVVGANAPTTDVRLVARCYCR